MKRTIFTTSTRAIRWRLGLRDGGGGNTRHRAGHENVRDGEPGAVSHRKTTSISKRDVGDPKTNRIPAVQNIFRR